MPVRIDRTDPPARGVPPGTYLLQVSDCASKPSKKDESMLHVTYKVASGACRGEEVEDYVMLEGKGRWMGHKKLEALGIDWQSDFEAYDLIGKRAWAAIVQESREYQGKTYKNARIDSRAEGSLCGLWPEGNPPEGVTVEDIPEDEGPF